MNPFHFNLEKTIQAAAVLLRQADAKMDNYMRILKLLYIADRKSLKDIGRPITGDQPVAMERGPVLSHVYDLIKGRAFDTSQWEKFIERRGFNIRLVEDPGLGKLNPYEIDTLQTTWNEYRDKDEWELSRETHDKDKFGEWKDPGNSSVPIPLKDILRAVGRLNDLAHIEEKAKISAAFTDFFGS